MAAMKCPLCGNMDGKPTMEPDGTMVYSQHPVKAMNPEVLCENSGKTHAGMEWFMLSGQDGSKRVIFPKDRATFNPEDPWLTQP